MQILFLGPPGAGKGTQSKRLADRLQLLHLSSGDLLREAVKAGTKAGQRAQAYMDRGELVPDDVLIEMFADKLGQRATEPGFILDGFPRNIVQAKELDRLLTALDKNLDMVINLQVDKELLRERIVGRRICGNKACNTPYHVTLAKPKKDNICDVCGSPLIQRTDDTEALVSQRLNAYYEQTAPLIEYYKDRGLLKTVNGDGLPDEIFQQLLKALSVTA